MGNRRRTKSKPKTRGEHPTINAGRKAVALTSGSYPLVAGDLEPGREYTVNTKTGETRRKPPVKPDPLKVRLVKRPPIKLVYDLSSVPDKELLDEMRKRGMTKITF